jgi:hypothetical protein
MLCAPCTRACSRDAPLSCRSRRLSQIGYPAAYPAGYPDRLSAAICARIVQRSSSSPLARFATYAPRDALRDICTRARSRDAPLSCRSRRLSQIGYPAAYPAGYPDRLSAAICARIVQRSSSSPLARFATYAPRDALRDICTRARSRDAPLSCRSRRLSQIGYPAAYPAGYPDRLSAAICARVVQRSSSSPLARFATYAP